MTTRLDALKELERMATQGTWPVDMSARDLGFPDGPSIAVWYSAFNGSLDAAMELHEAALSGWNWAITECDAWVYIQTRNGPPKMKAKAASDIPSRAWLLAIIRALISEETSNE